jgi:hypothetical protein
MEERRTAELMSDFDDYEIGGAEPEDSEMDDTGETGKGARKKKKTRQ